MYANEMYMIHSKCRFNDSQWSQFIEEITCYTATEDILTPCMLYQVVSWERHISWGQIIYYYPGEYHQQCGHYLLTNCSI